MKILLDLHIVLWFFGDTKKVPKEIMAAILNPENDKYVSIAALWELTIKMNLGKLSFIGGFDRFLLMLDENGFELLGITARHIRRLNSLPPVHGDPFDRMIVAQAAVESMYIATADKNIKSYGVQCV